MSSYAKILSLSYNSAVASKTSALKSYYRSVRLIKENATINPKQPSYVTNILLNGNCIDPETRNLYLWYIDTYFGSSWIIEVNIDTRIQCVVYYDKYNVIGFDPLFKIFNPRVIHGRLVWTDNKNPIYQMDIARAKKSFELGIGYGQFPQTEEWSEIKDGGYGMGQIVSRGNNYYKSLIDNNVNQDPRISPTAWEDLKCLIEDAYYSMNIRNFYFEPSPPSHAPEVSYQSDDTRKINNLRQTLFQVAYRYVYMDWRKSTFSPASIVPVPQAEEAAATGLANEIISLNNQLQIIVNSGGEEVRAVEIIARSSSDPSKWYLIETLNKFEEQERANQISRVTEAEFITLSMTLPDPTAEAVNSPDAESKTLGMIVVPPEVINSYVSSDVTGLSWLASEGGVQKAAVITAPPLNTRLTSFPSWLSVYSGGGLSLVAGMTIANGETITMCPTFSNTGGNLSGDVLFTNDYGDVAHIAVSQSAVIVIPPTPITPAMLIDPNDTSGLSLIGSSANAISGSASISYSMVPNHPGYSSDQPFTMFWRAVVNGNLAGSGTFIAYDEVSNTGVLTLTGNLVAGDSVIVYLSAEALMEVVTESVNMGMTPLLPEIINSSVASSQSGMSWSAEQSGLADAITSDISCPPANCIITSKPDWISIIGDDGYNLYSGWTIANGETISIFPTEDNLGSARSGYIVLTNEAGDTVSIIVSQAQAIAPPSGTPVTVTIQVYSGDSTGLSIPGSSASALSGNKNITWSALIAHSAHGEEIWTMYWRAKINNIVQGSGSFEAYNGSNTGEIVVDPTLLPGDVVVIDFSSITF